MSKPFQFKQFTVEQDQTAMKIGTDGVLLGAWTNTEDAYSILDIGTGTGVIALMLAQKSDAEIIDALEIDEDAHEQAVSNFENSDWGDRLFCYHASLLEFCEEIEDKYDFIVSNPPFYTDKNPSENEQRNKARFEESLPFDHLFEGVSKLLEENGKFTLIAPYKEEHSLVELASKYALYPTKICRVQGNEKSIVKRSLFEFSFEKKEIQYELLILETERHQYTDAYTALVKDFYLKL